MSLLCVYRTFAKLCRENKLLIAPLLPTDCDLIFASVKPTPNTKEIPFELFLRAIHALVEEGEDRTRVSCSIQCNYPYELLPMDISMRYGTQGILMSMRPLHAPVPATPGAAGGGRAAVGAEGQQAAAPTERI